MFHTIEFAVEVKIGVEAKRNRPLEPTVVERGARVRADVRPYVIEAEGGLYEVADLVFENGMIARQIPFAYFAFAD